MSSNQQWAPDVLRDPSLALPITSAGPVCAAPSDSDTRVARPAKRTSISRLAFPFNGRRKVLPPGPPSPPSPIPHRAPVEPPARAKHVRRPSPLGRGASGSDGAFPRSDSTDAPSNLRPQYHGHSRHSFTLTKWVWSTRQEQHKAQTATPHADLGSVQPESSSLAPLLPQAPGISHTSFQRLRRLRSFYAEEKKPEQAPLTMYPRQGDIAALRDPYCARVDRSFATVPLCTLRKIACLFAILAPRREAFDEAGSEMSYGSCTESDASTLVDSDAESEWDRSTTCSSRQEFGLDEEVTVFYDSNALSKGNLLSLAVRRVNRELDDVKTLHMTSTAWLCKLFKTPAFDNLPVEQRIWPRTWHGMWELLIELSRRDVGLASSPRVANAGKKEPTKPKPPKEFRWLKLLGGPKSDGTKKPLGGTVASRALLSQPSPSTASLPAGKAGACVGLDPPSPKKRPTILSASHPAAG